MKVRINRKKAFLGIYLFFIIFAPPFIKGISSLWIVFIYSVVMMLFTYSSVVKEILMNVSIRRFNFLFIGITIVTVGHMLIDYVIGCHFSMIEYIMQAYRFVGIIVIIQSTVVYAICYCKINGLTYQDVCDCIVIAGLIEAVFTYSMLFFPTIKTFFVNIFIKNVYGSVENAGFGSWVYDERFYGFANTLISGFGYGTGIIAGLAFLNIFEKKKNLNHVIIFLILIVVPMVNSITGVFIIFLAVGVKMISTLFSLKIKRKSFIPISLIAVFSIVAFLVLQLLAPAAMQRFIVNILAILGKYDGTTSYKNLRGEGFWTVPSKWIELLLGTGHDVYAKDSFVHSDVGYVNMLWLTGILGCFWLYGSFYYLCKQGVKKGKSLYHKLTVHFVMLSFFFFEFKDIGISVNTGIPIIMTVVYASVFLQDRMPKDFYALINKIV